MHKILIFDLDGTLAGIGEEILADNLLKLKQLKKEGYEIAVCSGKPLYYLCGFFRQAGLSDLWMIAENGAVFQKGIHLPPKICFNSPVRENVLRVLGIIKKEIDERLGERVWYQPNQVNLTPFPKDPEAFEVIQKLVDDTERWQTRVSVYRHCDCFDFIPREINKKNALTYFSKIAGFAAEDMIALGDGINDVPMFEYCDISISIGDELNHETTHNFDTIGEALDMLLKEKP